MKVEVDQSGRVEYTKQDSALCFSNGKHFTIFISRQVKRRCMQALKEKGMSGPSLYVRLFSVALFYLLKDHITKIDQMIIDEEYSGKEADIKEHLINLLSRAGYAIDPHVIQFGNIGKHAQAHKIALNTLRKEKEPDKRLSLADILRQF